MTIDEAIKFKENHRDEHYFGFSSDLVKADNLSIEALKVLRHGRLIGAHHDPALLPGETED